MELSSNLISVIVPVYNAKDYLEKCVDSLLKQTYSNIEIILVDDGSKDGSSELCEKLKKKDNRILVIHQKNQGVSAARNVGIKASRGDYVGFVDSDDYIEKDMLSTLYNNAISSCADISICGYRAINEKEIKDSEKKDEYNKNIVVSEDIDLFYKMIVKEFKGFMCNKLFSRNIIDEMKFDCNIKVCEDLLAIIEVSKSIKKFCYENTVLYNYIMRESSAIHKKDYSKYYTAVIAYKKIIKFLKKEESKCVDLYVFDKFKWENSIMKESCAYKKILAESTKADYKYILKSKSVRYTNKIETFIRYNYYSIFKAAKFIKKMIKNR